MNWKFWKRDEEDEEMSVTIDTDVIPMSTLFRWYCFDTAVKNPNKFAAAYGITPISAEGEEMEKAESQARLEKVVPYIQFLNVMSDINSAVLAQTLTDILDKYDLITDPEVLQKEHEIMEEIYKTIAMGALVSSFSAALSLGIIVNPGSYVGEVGADELE